MDTNWCLQCERAYDGPHAYCSEHCYDLSQSSSATTSTSFSLSLSLSTPPTRAANLSASSLASLHSSAYPCHPRAVQIIHPHHRDPHLANPSGPLPYPLCDADIDSLTEHHWATARSTGSKVSEWVKSVQHPPPSSSYRSSPISPPSSNSNSTSHPHPRAPSHRQPSTNTPSTTSSTRRLHDPALVSSTRAPNRTSPTLSLSTPRPQPALPHAPLSRAQFELSRLSSAHLPLSLQRTSHAHAQPHTQSHNKTHGYGHGHGHGRRSSAPAPVNAKLQSLTTTNEKGYPDVWYPSDDEEGEEEDDTMPGWRPRSPPPRAAPHAHAYVNVAQVQGRGRTMRR